MLAHAITLDRQLLVGREERHAHDTALPVLGFDSREWPGEVTAVSERFIAELR